MSVQHVEKRSVADQLADQLRSAIVHGELLPGQHLPAERLLAEQAGVNRQAVREALAQLRQMGLVDIAQGEGVIVRNWQDSAHFSVLYDCLFHPDGSLVLEQAEAVLRFRLVALKDAARLAAVRRTDEQLALLDHHIAAMKAESPDGPVMARLDIWDVIVDACDNVAYRMTYNSQGRIVRRLPPEVLAMLAAGAKLIEEYDQLVQALHRKDADEAERLTGIILGAIVTLLEQTLGLP